jgi:hypothetical protein
MGGIHQVFPFENVGIGLVVKAEALREMPANRVGGSACFYLRQLSSSGSR